VIKIEANTKRVVMSDRTQWFLAGMSIALSLQLSQSVTAAVFVGKTIQIVQTNSSGAAQKVYEEAEKLYEQGTAEAKRSASVKYEEALKLFRAVGDRDGEASTLSRIGVVYDDLEEKEKALEYFNQSLPLSRGVGDRKFGSRSVWGTAEIRAK
jgi:tetratricopeptide (TPR) repeat protein